MNAPSVEAIGLAAAMMAGESPSAVEDANIPSNQKKKERIELLLDGVKVLAERAPNPRCSKKGCYGRGYTGIFRQGQTVAEREKSKIVIICSCIGQAEVKKDG